MKNMIKGKHIRLFIGILSVLIILVPFTGFPRAGKNDLTILFGFLILVAVAHKAVIIEYFKIRKALQAAREETQKKTPQ
ncbi:MAG TPA: hypothetical protein VFM02_02045 [Candidatus Paceibacterota bacterium]|nr:hypothetical protein [Candidatus Paceibacterota bacterium]